MVDVGGDDQAGGAEVDGQQHADDVLVDHRLVADDLTVGRPAHGDASAAAADDGDAEAAELLDHGKLHDVERHGRGHDPPHPSLGVRQQLPTPFPDQRLGFGMVVEAADRL